MQIAAFQFRIESIKAATISRTDCNLTCMQIQRDLSFYFIAKI